MDEGNNNETLEWTNDFSTYFDYYYFKRSFLLEFLNFSSYNIFWMAMACFEEPLCPDSPRFRYQSSHLDLTGSSFEIVTKQANLSQWFYLFKNNLCPNVISNHLLTPRARREDKNDRFWRFYMVKAKRSD